MRWATDNTTIESEPKEHELRSSQGIPTIAQGKVIIQRILFMKPLHIKIYVYRFELRLTLLNAVSSNQHL